MPTYTIYRVTLLGGAESAKDFLRPIERHPPTTDEILKKIMDEEMLRLYGHASVYRIKNGELALEDNRIVPTVKITPYGSCQEDYEDTKTEVDRRDLEEKGLKREKPDLEKIEEAKKQIIQFFAEEDEKQNRFFVSFLKSPAGWFFAFLLFLMIVLLWAQ